MDNLSKEELTRIARENEQFRRMQAAASTPAPAPIPNGAVTREDFIEWMAGQLTLFDNHWRNEAVRVPNEYPEYLESNEDWIDQLNAWLELTNKK